MKFSLFCTIHLSFRGMRLPPVKSRQPMRTKFNEPRHYLSLCLLKAVLSSGPTTAAVGPIVGYLMAFVTLAWPFSTNGALVWDSSFALYSTAR